MPRRFSRPSARAARERQQLHSVVLRAPGAAPARRWRLELFRTRRDGMFGCIEDVVGECVGHCAAGVVGLTKRDAKRDAKRHAKRHAAVVGAVRGGGRRGRAAPPEALDVRD